MLLSLCVFPYNTDVVMYMYTLVPMYFSFVCTHLHVHRATSEVVSGRDRRNPDRHGGTFTKGSMVSVPPHRPLRVAQ